LHKSVALLLAWAGLDHAVVRRLTGIRRWTARQALSVLFAATVNAARHREVSSSARPQLSSDLMARHLVVRLLYIPVLEMLVYLSPYRDSWLPTIARGLGFLDFVRMWRTAKDRGR
jgi:hypothetical protein